MINQRIRKALKKPIAEVYGWDTTRPSKPHHFAIKNICAYVGPAMLYDQALNTNYYAIEVFDPDRVDEIREVFSKIEFTEEDFLASTKLRFYEKSLLIEKYEEALKK